MTAKEMFDEIGFIYESEDILTYLICYEKQENTKTRLVFNTITKDLFIHQYDDDGTNCRVQMDIATYKAITQQMKELRWLNNE